MAKEDSYSEHLNEPGNTEQSVKEVIEEDLPPNLSFDPNEYESEY